MSGRPAVGVLALGGTIAMTGDDGRGVEPSLTGEALVASLPELDDVAAVSAESFRHVPGANLGLDDMLALRDHLGERSEDGFVVSQGTDTLEETAFAMDLLHEDPRPVVFTGAMRNPSLPGSDGAANLLNAVQIAASATARDHGVLITMADSIHAARFVCKRHSSAGSAFRSPSAGPVGWVAEGRVRLPLQVRSRVGIDLPTVPTLPPVALVRVGMGDNGRLLASLTDQGYAGVVIDALGVGHVPADWVDPLKDLARDVPVVFASRTGAGETFAQTYGFPGSETDLLQRGLLPEGVLDGIKSRVLLSLAIAAGWSRTQIHEAVETFMG